MSTPIQSKTVQFTKQTATPRCAAWFPHQPATNQLMGRVDEIARSCPSSGDGVHRWLFRAALKLHRLHINPADVESVLNHATSDCGRAMNYKEVEDAVRSAWVLINQGMSGTSAPRWAARDYGKILEIVARGPKVEQIKQRSPRKFENEVDQAETVIDALFPGNPLVCVGRSAYEFQTRPREEWRGFLDQMQFVVPSPMTAQVGKTKGGKSSEHALDNTGERAFLVIEFDFKNREEDDCRNNVEEQWVLRSAREWGMDILDICAALHSELAKYRPLALIVHSGSKSLHGWYPCRGETDEALASFMRYAVSIGADPATWTRSQFVRIPGGRRNNGKKQEVLYFRPELLEVAK